MHGMQNYFNPLALDTYVWSLNVGADSLKEAVT